MTETNNTLEKEMLNNEMLNKAIMTALRSDEFEINKFIDLTEKLESTLSCKVDWWKIFEDMIDSYISYILNHEFVKRVIEVGRFYRIDIFQNILQYRHLGNAIITLLECGAKDEVVSLFDKDILDSPNLDHLKPYFETFVRRVVQSDSIYYEQKVEMIQMLITHLPEKYKE